MPQVAIPLFISLALYAVARILQPKTPGPRISTLGDVRISTSTIGQPINFVIGTARISPVIVYYNNLVSAKIRSGGGGKGKGGSKSSTEIHYYLDLLEILCTGPVDSIDGIFQDEDPLNFDTYTFGGSHNIDTVTNPNGEDSRVIIYKGSSDQPIEAELSSRLVALNGPSTAYPFLCYALWLRGAMGTGLNWANLNYVVTRYPTYTINNQLNNRVTGADGSFGVNPAYAIMDILLNPLLGEPYSRAQINENSLEVIANICKHEGIYVNFAIESVTDREALFSSLCADLGIIVFEKFGQLVFRMARTNVDYKVLRDTTSSLLLETPAIETGYLINQNNNQIYKFLDETLNYRVNQVQDMDLASIKGFAQRVYESRNFDFITSQLVARKLMDLQKSLTAVNVPATQFKIASHDVYLEPSNRVKVDNVYWKVLKTEEKNNEIIIDVLPDMFRYSNNNAATNFGYSVITPVLQPIIGLETTGTTYVECRVFEVPWELNNYEEGITLGIAGIKPNSTIIEVDYQINKNTDTTGIYYSKSITPIFSQGLLVSSTDTSYVYLNLNHADQDPITETQFTDDQWENNTLVALINDEIVSIKSIETSLSSSYKIAFSNLKRGRFGTEEQTTFTTNAIFFFGDPITIGQDNIITYGTINVKPLTMTIDATLELGNTRAVSYNITGIAQNPVPPENLSYNRVGLNVTFSWDLYEKSPAGKVFLPVTSTPSYGVQYSVNGISWTTKSAPYTTITILSATPITLYVRDIINASGRTSVKRFKTSS